LRQPKHYIRSPEQHGPPSEVMTWPLKIASILRSVTLGNLIGFVAQFVMAVLLLDYYINNQNLSKNNKNRQSFMQYAG